MAQHALNTFIPNIGGGQSQAAPMPSVYTVASNLASYAGSGGSNSKAPPAPSQPNANVNANGNANVQYTQAPPADCLIPDCGQPVHVDPTGMQASEYCSQRHREYVLFPDNSENTRY